MTFKRARTEEQKEQRIEEILKVTEALFQKNNYEDITLKMIADQLDYTRANLYKYVPSKEAIFLLIFEKQLHRWIEDVLQTFSKSPSQTTYDFADIWAKTMTKYQTMLRIDNLLSSIIENNITFENLIEFKSTIINDFYRLIPIVKSNFPFFQDKDVKNFLFFQLMYANALQANITARNKQMKILKICDPDYHFIEFYPAFREYIYTQICGLETIHNKKTDRG
jgi:AcrR family transcriptional regulator